jgi:cysteine desulfurase/selenocysteine lyase
VTSVLSETTTTPYDVEEIRRDFAVLSRKVNGRPLVYLDSASSSHKPRQVLDAERAFVEQHYSNVHRGVHSLSQEATDAYEAARTTVAEFIGAEHDEVVFTKNVTESLNLVAYCLSNPGSPISIGPGDEIVVTEMEHHSNLVPWQLLAERTGATLKWFGLTDDGRLDLADGIITDRTKVVAFVHQSNLLGTVNPVAEIVARAKAVGALTVVDAAQSVPHMAIDVRELGADLVAFTGHKMLAPTGVGVLWGRNELLSSLPPFLGGGSMIETVTLEKTTYMPPPARFEAGTPPIVQAVGLGAAVDYLSHLGMPAIAWHEKELTTYALEALATVPGLRIFGPAVPVGRGGTISFALDGIHPHDVGQVLDSLGIQVRVGHHCARPTCVRFGVPAMTRLSFYLYSTNDEVDALVRGLEQVRKVFS